MNTRWVNDTISDITFLLDLLPKNPSRSDLEPYYEVLGVIGKNDNHPLDGPYLDALKGELANAKVRILEAARAIALITVNGAPAGTGFLLRDGDKQVEATFVTALHVIDSETTAAHARIFFVELDHDGAQVKQYEWRVRPNSFAANPPEDWAAMLLDPREPTTTAPRGLLAASFAQDATVVTIHRPHGRFELSSKRELCVPSEGNASELDYKVDTAFGSSGAPVLDQHWNVLAVHSGVRKMGEWNRGVCADRVRLLGQSRKRRTAIVPPMESRGEQIFPGWYALTQSGIEVGRVFVDQEKEVWYQFTSSGTQPNGTPYQPFADFTPTHPETLSYEIDHQGVEGYFVDAMIANSSSNTLLLEAYLPVNQKRQWQVTYPDAPTNPLDGIVGGYLYVVKQNGVWSALFALSGNKQKARWWLFTKDSSVGTYKKFVGLRDSTPTADRTLEFVSQESDPMGWGDASPVFIEMDLQQ